MTIYSLNVLLSQFGINPLFYVQFKLLLLDLHQLSQEAGKVVWYSHLFKNLGKIAYHMKGGDGGLVTNSCPTLTTP